MASRKLVKKRVRRRKKKYLSGTHTSSKSLSGLVQYKSSWEYNFMFHMDNNPDIISYSYEPFYIEYVSNNKTGKIRKYYPDFLIEYKNGKKELTEVKRTDRLNNSKVQKKIKAAKEWCITQKERIEFKICNTEQIKEIIKINKMNYPTIFQTKPKKKKKLKIKKKT